MSLQHCLSGYELLTVKPRRKWHYPMPGYRDKLAVFVDKCLKFPHQWVFRRWYHFVTPWCLEDGNRRFVLTCSLLQVPTYPAESRSSETSVSSYQTIRCHNREPEVNHYMLPPKNSWGSRDSSDNIVTTLENDWRTVVQFPTDATAPPRPPRGPTQPPMLWAPGGALSQG